MPTTKCNLDGSPIDDTYIGPSSGGEPMSIHMSLHGAGITLLHALNEYYCLHLFITFQETHSARPDDPLRSSQLEHLIVVGELGLPKK